MDATLVINLTAGFISISENSVISADTPNPLEIDVPVAKSGTLTTRTDDDTGVVTVATGHGITDADTVDIYTAAGELLRKDCNVTATTSTTISIDAGSGTALPVTSTVLIVGKQVAFLPTILSDKIQLFALQLVLAGATTKGRAVFFTAAPAVAGSGDGDFTLVANQGQIYNVAGGQANPLDGDDVVSAAASQANTTLGARLKILSLEDRTP